VFQAAEVVVQVGEEIASFTTSQAIVRVWQRQAIKFQRSLELAQILVDSIVSEKYAFDE
jgi:hypothetical protein